MQTIAWVFLGTVAFVATLVTLWTNDNDTAIITGLFGMLAALLFAYFALDVTTIDSSGTVHTMRYPSMAVFGLAMAAPNLYIAVTGPLEWINEQTGRSRGVR